jgi:AcrR family transcriptional regulator
MAVGDRIPADFIAARKSRRILKALAELLDEKGYRATKIADIVRQAGVARKTFYDNFGGKDDAARALVAQALPDLHGWVDLASIERTGLSLLAVELSAAAVAREGHDVAARATSALDSLRGLPDSIHPAEPASELLCSLPPGRHGLPREFIAHNQRARLLHAFPAAVVEHGYQPVTVADVTKVAHLSRRTFYQHFKAKEPLALALASTSAPAARLLDDVDLNSGLGTLAVEVVAAGVCEGTRAAASMVAEIEEALRPIAGAHLEQVAA